MVSPCGNHVELPGLASNQLLEIKFLEIARLVFRGIGIGDIFGQDFLALREPAHTLFDDAEQSKFVDIHGD